jgi:hypothetical protein
MRIAIAATLAIFMTLYASAQTALPVGPHEGQVTESSQQAVSASDAALPNALDKDSASTDVPVTNPVAKADNADPAAQAGPTPTAKTHRSNVLRNVIIISALGAALYLVLGLAAKN